MLNKTDKIILDLIRKALDKEYQVDASAFANAPWADVIEKATEQGVLGICFEAIELLPELSRPDIDNLMEWLGQVEYQTTLYLEHKKAIEELATFYADNGLRMMLLKGYGLSQYWPKPEHRPVGDIDIFLSKVVSDGFRFHVVSDGVWKEGDQLIREKLGIEVEEGHEHHTTFNYKGIMVENHYDFINTKAHKDALRIEENLKSLSTINTTNLTNKLFLPSVDFNAIFLIRHLGQHFAGEHVTLRQILDWGLFLQHDEDKINWVGIVPFLKEMGIWTFFNQINAICVDFLGTKISNTVPTIERNQELENRIIEDILHPEFSEEKPNKLLPVLLFKAKRWYYNRWKHPLIYNEWWLPMFLTLIWSHLRRIKTIKD